MTNKKTIGIFTILLIYIVLLLIDLGTNIIAIFIPAIGGLAETLTEGVIEITQLVLVIVLVFIKDR